MSQQAELPNIVSIVSEHITSEPAREFLLRWENIIYASLAAIFLIAVFWFSGRKKALIPDKLQSVAELVVSGIDTFVVSVVGKKGRKLVPFIGTLFLYILTMNFMGLIPFLKSPTASLSTTFALALCVFVYVQYTAIRNFGIFGYFDHMMGKPRGAMLLSVVFPIFLLVLHLTTELVRPITLSLRLRSNIWGDDLLLAILSKFGLVGLPLLLFSTILGIVTAIVQAAVFCLLATVYFALIMEDEEEHKLKEG